MHPDPDQCSSFSSRLARFSLDRRVTVFVLILTIVVMGLIAAMGLPMELFPQGYETKFLSVYVLEQCPCGGNVGENYQAHGRGALHGQASG